MSNDPMSALLQDNNARIQAVKQLSDAHTDLVDAIRTYREAWKQARELGWATTDLTRKGGFTSPTKLPHPKRPAPAGPSSAPSPRTETDQLD